MPPPPGRVESSRVTEEVTSIRSRERIQVTEYALDVTEEVVAAPVDTPIIDVPEEPLVPAPETAPPTAPPVWSRIEEPQRPANTVDAHRASHRRPEPPAEPAVVHEGLPVSGQPPVHPPAAPWRPPETRPRRGRHWTPEDGAPAEQPGPGVADGVRGRHGTEPSATPLSGVQTASAAAGRHRGGGDVAVEEAGATEESAAHHTGGHSVADLMARLNLNEPPAAGGRRRRDDDADGAGGGGRRRRDDDGGGGRRRDEDSGGGRRRRDDDSGGGRRRREQ